MNKTKITNSEMLQTEVNSAINGFHQEIKELVLKYGKAFPLMGGMYFEILVGKTDLVSCIQEAVTQDCMDAVAKEISIDQEDDEDFDFEDEDDIGFGDEDEEEIEPDDEPVAASNKVDDKLLNSSGHITMAYRNSKSEAVLFAAHPTKQ